LKSKFYFLHGGWLTAICLLLLSCGASAQTGQPLNTGTPIGFFTNFAGKLLQSEMNLNLSHIQVYPLNQYTPAVHRLLQVTANIYDCTTNRTTLTAYPYLPTIFRPQFTNDNGTIYISGYVEDDGANAVLIKPRDLQNPDDRAALQADDNVYGVPLIIGAKKGFPNFNEFSMAVISQFTRKVQIVKTATQNPSQWNYYAQYVVGISNVFSVELWNSYTSTYPRDVSIYVTNELTMKLTNNWGVALFSNVDIGTSIFLPANVWPASAVNITPNTSAALILPLFTDFVFVPDSVYLANPPSFTTNLNAAFDGLTPTDRAPQWGLSVTNRLRVIMQDTQTGRLIDYVQLGVLGDSRKITEDLQPLPVDTNNNFKDLWDTNRLITIPPNLTKGINSQIQLSLGNQNSPASDWTPYMILPPGYNKNFEVDKFRSFYGFSTLYGGYTAAQLAQIMAASTNTSYTVPFIPTAKIFNYRTWQANDPLVHYLTDDLTDLQQLATKPSLVKSGSPITNALPNMRVTNTRFQPWGGNPQNPDDIASDLAFKDPLVTRSDDWNFPSGVPLNFNWLGGVHRGTPWQTVYFKSSTVSSNRWQLWTGDARFADAGLTMPTNDWRLASLFISLMNTNPPGSLLSVNQTDWSPAFGAGVNVWTNTLDDGSVDSYPTPTLQFTSLIMASNSPQSGVIANGINNFRFSRPGHYFYDIGDLLGTPELSVNTPWLNLSDAQRRYGIVDAAYEVIPSQILPLLRTDSIGAIAQNYGQFQIQFTGLDGHAYTVETSTDLMHWSPVGTQYPTNGIFTFSDPGSAGPGTHYYRSVMAP
jgi:hypothetical protein